MTRLRPLAAQWPIVLGLALVWGALWQDLSPGVLLAGAAYAVLVVVLFPLPPVPFSGRMDPWRCLTFGARFLGDVVRASLSVAAVILTRGSTVRSSVVEVPLRTDDDLVLTLVSHALALVPGSLVLDVDRAKGTLYLHCLGVTDEAGAERVRRDALRVEEGIVRAVGSRADLDALARDPDGRRAAAPPDPVRPEIDPDAAALAREEAR